ncbi:hypothetical protein B0J18DRAFT_148160 [Chaetomium sp. MPI-SDFR-AT-0129]|nr:hypothetical protein B0J18DRAFT_148160 [Chaetomium sp. MPI-SDFR-AT-0129]
MNFSVTMIHNLGYLALLSMSGLVSAQHLFHRNEMYGSHPALQPEVTVTVTATHLVNPTGDGNACNVVYVPTTVTVYTSCTSYVSSVPGLPISTHNTPTPWTNSTSEPSTPCTQSWPTRITPPRNFSTSLGWNHTMPALYPTLTGSAGTLIESAEPIRTSSALWANSTRATTTLQNSTIHISRTVISSAIVTVTTAGIPVSSLSLSTGTNPTGTHTASASYQSTMTYRTTVTPRFPYSLQPI